MTAPPLALLAELTHRCPLRCPYCSNPTALTRPGEELDTATWSRLFAEAANATAEKRPDLYKKVQQILVEDLPILWLTEMEFPSVHRCNIKDIATTAIGINDALREARKE